MNPRCLVNLRRGDSSMRPLPKAPPTQQRVTAGNLGSHSFDWGVEATGEQHSGTLLTDGSQSVRWLQGGRAARSADGRCADCSRRRGGREYWAFVWEQRDEAASHLSKTNSHWDSLLIYEPVFINTWHLTGYKPYLLSMGSWLTGSLDCLTVRGCMPIASLSAARRETLPQDAGLWIFVLCLSDCFHYCRQEPVWVLTRGHPSASPGWRQLEKLQSRIWVEAWTHIGWIGDNDLI